MFEKNVAFNFSEFMSDASESVDGYTKLLVMCSFFLKRKEMPVIFEYRENCAYEIDPKLLADFFFLGKVKKKEIYRSENVIELDDYIEISFSDSYEQDDEYEEREKILILLNNENRNLNNDRYLKIYTLDKEQEGYSYIDLSDAIQGFLEKEKIDSAIARYIDRGDYEFYLVDSRKQETNIQNLEAYLQQNCADRSAIVLLEGEYIDVLYKDLVEELNDTSTLFRGINFYSVMELLIESKRCCCLSAGKEKKVYWEI